MPQEVSTIVTVVITTLILGLALRASKRHQLKDDPRPGQLQFCYGRFWLGLGLFTLVIIPLVLTTLVLQFPPKDSNEAWSVVGIYVMCAGLGGVATWESLRFRLTVSPEGLDCQSPWRSW